MTSPSEYIDVIKVVYPSLVMATAVGFAASILGVFVLLRREAMVALALPQVVAVGAAIGLRMGWPSLPPAMAAVVVAMLLILGTRTRGGRGHLLPSLYVAGLSLSLLIIAGSGAHVAELQALFTGIDVAVSVTDMWIATPALLGAGLLVAIFARRWLLLAQARQTAEVSGVATMRWEVFFLLMLALVLLLGTNALGVMMVLGMLFLPAAAVLPLSRRISGAVIEAACVSIVMLVGGFLLSVENEWPLSQSVSAVGFGLLLVCQVISFAL